jgi:ABC-type uncharacterized transport system involved in gliding motility auxiliary subunit
MMMQTGQRGAEPWALISELRRDFTVKQVEANAEKIDDDIKVLLVIHPKNITDATEYALDQFVLRGGKLIAFLDPLCVLDSRGGNPMMGSPPSSSSLKNLLKAWGIQFDTMQIVADMNYAGNTRAGRNIALLDLTGPALNSDDIVTGQVDNLLLAFCGAFTGTPAAGLKETVLIKSSSNAELVDAASAQMNVKTIENDFKGTGIPYTLGLRLSGKFKTAFPEGKPKSAKPDANDGAGKTALIESSQENEVVLIGDCDLLFDEVSVQEMPTPFGQRVIMPRNGNLNLAQSLLEQLSGDSNLIAMRSRASRDRPFVVVNKMKADAEAAYHSRIKDLEGSLAETQRKLNELQQGKEAGQRFILSPEQQTELQNFRAKEADVCKDLKVERKKLRQDTDSLENRVKWLNIAGMPAVIAFSGLILAVAKRKRTAAR